jgi:hypothetical protein
MRRPFTATFKAMRATSDIAVAPRDTNAMLVAQVPEELTVCFKSTVTI